MSFNYNFTQVEIDRANNPFMDGYVPDASESHRVLISGDLEKIITSALTYLITAETPVASFADKSSVSLAFNDVFDTVEVATNPQPSSTSPTLMQKIQGICKRAFAFFFGSKSIDLLDIKQNLPILMPIVEDLPKLQSVSEAFDDMFVNKAIPKDQVAEIKSAYVTEINTSAIRDLFT